MDACELPCAAARPPFLRNEIDVVHYRPGEECEKVGAQNKPFVVCKAFEEVGLCDGFHVHHNTRELMLMVHNGEYVSGIANHGTRELLLTIHSARGVRGVESTCCGGETAGVRCFLAVRVTG